MKAPVRWLLVFGTLICALAFVPAVLADSQARIVRLSYIDGTVQIDRNTGQFEKAIMNMPIVQGTRLVTQEDARAEVEFEDGSTIRLGPAAELNFTDLSLRDDGGKVSTVEVIQGMAYFDIRSDKHDEFRVAFAGDEVLLDRAANFRLDVAEDQVALAVYKGELNVQGGEEVTVKKNNTLEIDPVNGTSEVAKGITEDPLDDWVKAREDFSASYSARQSYGAPNAGYYGVDDLNYYGDYSYQPGWGWLWRPRNIGFGWDPFYNGAWCWYPGYGYTWVSSYPWGWIPYRYGNWTYIPGWGWGWAPGGWGGWQTVPRVVNAPPTFRGPQPPRVPPTLPVNPRNPNARPLPHPTIIVEAHNPRVEAFRDMPLPRRPNRTMGADRPFGGDRGAPSRDNGATRNQPGNTRAPRPNTDGARPSPRSDGPTPRVDRPSQPSPRVDRPSAPSPRVDRPSAPSPRVERPSGPPPSAPRMSSPSSGPPSSAPARPTGSGRPPK